MTRELLRLLLSSGPALKLDLCGLGRKPIGHQPPAERLFANAYLNRAVLFKRAASASAAEQPNARPISTYIYFPYDPQRPGDGGESLVYSRRDLLAHCDCKLRVADFDPQALQGDLDKLDVLDAVPTFSPFLVHLAFRHAGIFVPPSVIEVPAEVQRRMIEHVQSRMRPLMVCAFAGSTTRIERAVTEFTQKLLDPRSREDIRLLGTALQLPADHAPEYFSGWVGVAFYEYEHAASRRSLAEFTSWMNVCTQTRDRLRSEDRKFLTGTCGVLRQRLCDEWNDVVRISGEYRASYEAMMTRGDLEPLRAFLKACPRHYWRMGDILGRFEQITCAWRHFMRRYPDRQLPYAELRELFDILRPLLVTPAKANLGDDLGGVRPAAPVSCS